MHRGEQSRDQGYCICNYGDRTNASRGLKTCDRHIGVANNVGRADLPDAGNADKADNRVAGDSNRVDLAGARNPSDVNNNTCALNNRN